jgi:hypothetical protein
VTEARVALAMLHIARANWDSRAFGAGGVWRAGAVRAVLQGVARGIASKTLLSTKTQSTLSAWAQAAIPVLLLFNVTSQLRA